MNFAYEMSYFWVVMRFPHEFVYILLNNVLERDFMLFVCRYEISLRDVMLFVQKHIFENDLLDVM
jgi:hypothetical protein